MLEQVSGLHVGIVEMCSPSEIKILLDETAPQDVAFNAGRPQGFPRINGYVLLPNEGGSVVAVISRMTMEPAPIHSQNYSSDKITFPASRRRLFVTPLGVLQPKRKLIEGQSKFSLRRGVASYPSVGDAVLLPTEDQLSGIVEASGSDRRVRIGASHLALNTPVTIDPDKLFGRHLGVFGNTGSGKSCTMAGLIRWSIEAAAQKDVVNAHFIILDPNGEYRTCFNDMRNRLDVKVFSVEPGVGEEQLVVPGWMWNGQEWAGALHASAGTQRPALMQAIRQLRNAGILGTEPNDDFSPNKLLLSMQANAFSKWLAGLRAEGATTWTNYPKMLAMHSQLAGMTAQLRNFSVGLAAEDPILAPTLDAITICDEVTSRRTSGQYKNAFVDEDFEVLLGGLSALRGALPSVAIAGGATEDTPLAFDLNDLPDMIDFVAGLQGGSVQQNMAGLDLRLRTLLSDKRIGPIIAPEQGIEKLSVWLEGMYGTADGGRGQLSILDLSLVPSDVLTTVVAVLGRLVFETAQRYRRAHKATLPTVLVLEEAHNFVQRHNADAEAEGPSVRCRQIFEKIAKEGRKFGVGLVLSSQRPAELSPTVVAQCNSFILHRIVNDRDQELVSKLAPDTTGTLLKELPSLPSQQALLMGISSEIPLLFEVDTLELKHRPSSANPDFWDVWTGERELKIDLDELAASWGA